MENVAGESIAISAEFENHSSRTVIPYATLHQTQMFFANGKTRVRGTKFTVLTGQQLMPLIIFIDSSLILFLCILCMLVSSGLLTIPLKGIANTNTV